MKKAPTLAIFVLTAHLAWARKYSALAVLKCAAVILLCSSAVWASFTRVQHATNNACSSSSTTCACTVASTGSGNAIVIGAALGSSTASIASVSGGGTYSHCANCLGSESTGGVASDIFYTLSSTSGATTITVTRTAGTFGWSVECVEYSSSAPVLAVDASNNRDNSSPSNTLLGVALTLGGGNDVGRNDVIFQVEFGGGSTYANSVNSPYNMLESVPHGYADLLNTNLVVPPTWNMPSSIRMAASAIAITEVGSQFHPHSRSRERSLLELPVGEFHAGRMAE